ncbi:MAG: NHLP bacteriocin system secretion protein [Acidobacteriota bacterium]
MLQLDTGVEDFDSRIREEQRKLKNLNENQEGNSLLRSTEDGRVAGVLATEGSLIKAGGRIVNLEAAGEPYRLILYVKLAEGQKVKAEMEARIAPTTVKPEEYGYIKGAVRSVSTQPVTPEQVRSTFNNDKLVEQFIEGTPFEVIIDPDPDGDRTFEWTNPKGQALEIDSNTPCTARITVATRAPIELVVPFLLDKIGIS